MSKKIGIVTYVRVNNYGAELQAFALQRKMESMGYDAEIIDYPFGLSPLHKSCGEKLSVPVSIKERIRCRMLALVHWFIRHRYAKNQKERNENFLSFHRNHSRMSNLQILSLKDLYKTDFDYDTYCVGSDQVWNYTMGYSLMAYFLDFAKKGAKKISYGSSMGLSKLDGEAAAIYKEYLSKFDAIAVREQQAADLLQKVLERDVNVVLDPTLLLTADEWRTVASYQDQPKEKYLLLYVVTIKPCEYAVDLAEYIAKAKGWKIVRLSGSASTSGHREGIIEKPAVGPDGFVGLIDNAELVVTNSFHGTVFSLNFQTPFITVVNPGKNNNSRMQSILSRVGLADRMIEMGGEFPSLDITDCNFDGVAEKLAAEREQSVTYLKNALEL